MRKSKLNTSGVTGVTWINRDSRWKAFIGNRTLGYFKEFDDAVEARLNAQKEEGYHENHGKGRWEDEDS